jgi:hypothetical protein
MDPQMAHSPKKTKRKKGKKKGTKRKKRGSKKKGVWMEIKRAGLKNLI